MVSDVLESEPAAAPRNRLLLGAAAAAAVLLIAALIAACWFGFGWAHAAVSEKPRADARESALDGARQAAVNLNSINPGDVQGSVKLMQSSATGAMLDQLNQNKDKVVELATQSKARLDSSVIGATLTELNTDDDTAKAFVVLAQTNTYPDRPPVKQRVSWTLDMKKDGDTWKASQVSSLGVPVVLDGPAPGQPAPALPAPGER